MKSLARFRTSRLLLSGLGVPCLIFATFGIPLLVYQRDISKVFADGIWGVALPVAWIGSIYLLIMWIMLVIGMLQHGGIAVYVRGRRLVYMNRLFMSIATSDIEEVKIQEFRIFWMTNDNVVIVLKGGKRKFIPIDMLDVDGPTLVNRIRAL